MSRRDPIRIALGVALQESRRRRVVAEDELRQAAGQRDRALVLCARLEARNRDLQRTVDGLTRAVVRVQDDNAALRAEVMRGDAQRVRRDVQHIEVSAVPSGDCRRGAS